MITINGVEVLDYKIGFPTKQSLDDDYDNGTLVIPITSQDVVYPMYSKVTITVDNISEYYYIAKDYVEVVSWNPLRYKHQLTLIESTQRISGVIGSTLVFTQKTDGSVRYTMRDVLERIRDTIPLALTSELSSTRKVTLNSNLLTYANQFKAPQFRLSRPTLIEAFNQVLKFLGARTRLDDYNELNAEFYNALQDLITLDNIVDEKQEQDISLYATKVESYVENFVAENRIQQNTIVYPSNVGWASVRAPFDIEDLTITSENLAMIVDRPIDQVIFIKAKFVANLQDQGVGSIPNVTIEQDFTELLFEFEQWRSLTTSSGLDDISKRTSVFYRRGGKIIEGFGKKYGFFTETVLRKWGTYLARKQEGDTITDVGYNDITEIKFRIGYIPQDSTRIQMEKNKSESFAEDIIQIVNQRDNIVDIEDMGTSMQSQVNRMGVPSKTVTKIVTNKANAYKIGQYTDDNYIVVEVENTHFIGYIVSRAKLSKDYQRLSEFVAVNNEIRSYEIPDKQDRELYYSQYVELSYVDRTDDNFLTNLGKSYFFGVVRNITIANSAIEVCEWTSKDISKSFLIACNSIAVGTTLAFTFGFDNNVSAGEKVVVDGSANINQPVKYTNDDGTLLEFSFKLAGKYNTASNEDLSAKALPEIYNASDVGNIIIETGDFYLYKDPAEAIKKTYQLKIFGEEQYDFIIGEYLCHNNPIVTPKNSSNQLKIWVSTTPFNYFQNRNISTVATRRDDYSYTDVLANYSIIPNFNGDNQPYWALADDDGNLYFAVNDYPSGTPVAIYFNFLKERYKEVN
jgi:hypothetical protein